MVAHIMKPVVKSSISAESFSSAATWSTFDEAIGACDMPSGFPGSLLLALAERLDYLTEGIEFGYSRSEFPMSMADRDGFIWYDGKLVPWREANTHVLTHSLHYGLAVFEGVRAYKTAIGTAVFRLKEHTERLFSSAHIYMMKIPFTREKLMQAQLEVVRANEHEACYIRPIAFYGSEKMGVSPIGARVHVAIAAWPWGAS